MKLTRIKPPYSSLPCFHLDISPEEASLLIEALSKQIKTKYPSGDSYKCSFETNYYTEEVYFNIFVLSKVEK